MPRHKDSGSSLRITDQETARVVAIHRSDGEIVGAGCLVNGSTILTCQHVVAAALSPTKKLRNKSVLATLTGVSGAPTVHATVRAHGTGTLTGDLALLKISAKEACEIPDAEFSSPLRHSGKTYSALGFPNGDPQGRNASGRLHAADAIGLVQMDGSSALFVKGGFSGAPVWSSEVGSFVGIVVTELADAGVSWCIPSRILCNFYNALPVRFRVPSGDRPQIHDYEVDDPNLELFGNTNHSNSRKLSAKIKKDSGGFKIKVTYECLLGSPKPRGKWVTFITYPDFKQDNEDAYELFAAVKFDVARKRFMAQQTFYSDDLFSVAAIGDGGQTALTLNLEAEQKRQKNARNL